MLNVLAAALCSGTKVGMVRGTRRARYVTEEECHNKFK